MSSSSSLSIAPSLGKLPRLPFLRMKDAILGKRYELSIATVPRGTSQKLNNEYRGKNYPTNILSFGYSKTHGELILHLPTIKKQAPDFDMPYKIFLAYLLIHGMLHLKGMAHGSTMESSEKRYMKKFGFQK